MDTLASRALNDGSRTVISLLSDGERFIVQAENANGKVTTSVTAADAYNAYMHPFSRAEWLSYPGTEKHGVLGFSVEAYLAHAEDMAEVDRV